MPKFIIETTAESPISEFWLVEAPDAHIAREAFEQGTEFGTCLWDEVVGEETDREVAQVHTFADMAATVAFHKAQMAGPDMLKALYQYRDDLRYPPTPDSVERRIAMIDAIIDTATAPATAPAIAPDPDPDQLWDDDSYPTPCSDPGGHVWPGVEEHERCLCIHCGADGDA